MKTFIKTIVLGCITVFLSSCTLDVQDEFKFEPGIDDSDPFLNMTAWEFIQTQTTDALVDDQNRKRMNPEQLDYLIAAIKRVGYEDWFNQKSTDSRTYLLMNNNCFTGGNADKNVYRVVTGRTLSPNARTNADSVMAEITEPEEINKLKAFLRYHIVSDYIDQVPTIPIYDQNFLYKTFLPIMNIDALTGEPTGLSNEMTDISFRRDTRWVININNATAPLPETANARGFDENVRKHNIVLNNGIAHYLNDTVRYQPYQLYANFSLD